MRKFIPWDTYSVEEKMKMSCPGFVVTDQHLPARCEQLRAALAAEQQKRLKCEAAGDAREAKMKITEKLQLQKVIMKHYPEAQVTQHEGELFVSLPYGDQRVRLCITSDRRIRSTPWFAAAEWPGIDAEDWIERCAKQLYFEARAHLDRVRAEETVCQLYDLVRNNGEVVVKLTREHAEVRVGGSESSISSGLLSYALKGV